MSRLILLAALILTAAAPAWAQAPSALCRSAIAAAERALNVPDRLMQAIGIVESGRPDERGGTTAWPWTINVEGTGYVYDSKAAAIAAVNGFRAQGARSIDVGCMQVNILHHGDAFASLEQAFDPFANARYAAEFLQRLLAQTGSWPRAAAGYHSMTPDIGADYARKVLAVWARPGLGEAAPFAPKLRPGPTGASIMPPASAFAANRSDAPIPPAAGTLSLPGSATARIIPLGAGNAPSSAGATGRGLDAYRAAPTRMAGNLLLRRG